MRPPHGSHHGAETVPMWISSSVGNRRLTDFLCKSATHVYLHGNRITIWCNRAEYRRLTRLALSGRHGITDTKYSAFQRLDLVPRIHAVGFVADRPVGLIANVL